MVSSGQFKVVPEEEWERWPSRYSAHSSPWLAAVDALERGEVIEVHWSDTSELKSITMTIARRASKRGFRVLTRDAEDHTRLYRRAPETPMDAEESTAQASSATHNGLTKPGRKR